MELVLLKRCGAGLSPQSSRLNSRSVNVEFVVDSVALEHAFFRVLQFYTVTIIRPGLHTHISLASHECYVILVTDIIKYNKSPCSPHRGQIVYTLIAFLAV